MRIDIISIFPELVRHWFSRGVIGRALNKSDNTPAVLHYWNPRDYSDDRHRRVDDRPFGGGPGMVMQYTPLARVADAINADGDRPLHIYLSPQGSTFNHELAAVLARKTRIALWCGRYEGIDQRFLDEHIDAEISIGDFVLSGGEIAAAIIIDAILRLVPGVLGDEQSAQEDSFQQKLLDHPHYTRPENTAKIRAPEILLSGNHAYIAQWRMKQALGRTFLHRPDIFCQLDLSDAQQKLLNEFLTEQQFGEPS
ncbi:tRNA (guanosine(37)-N1)-methyltransferase TrmD [uncultured Cardiobacterium sp.]|uniref:tRNA (guanosine(37)-N1)-methyltransferase TrmD n=1 Tax=uncultured Cardiobacterium sp. TaxID=417619 RepID=UPI00262B78A4|nr:tRNA (guanosine(37)-N1)-methyltransferase TrmD [uncultured Cardiobacterium sp.]